MKINRFSFHDKARGWRLEPVQFKDLTLLIGASGVGKTLILDSILTLKAIADGSSFKGVEWEIEFETIENLKYKWKGAFENKGYDYFSIAAAVSTSEKEKIKEKNKPGILYEEVYLNNRQVVKRSQEEIIFNGGKTPRLSQQESIIKLLKEEDAVAPAYNGFKQIISSKAAESKGSEFPAFTITSGEFVRPLVLKKYGTLKNIRQSDENIATKLFLAYKNVPEVFNKIKERFIDVFPQVEDIKIEPIKIEAEIDPFIKEQPYIQIKESGVNKWIHQFRISSGMFRALIHISELYLVSDGTLILIDEFENSLGVNCIDELTNEVITAKRNLQFIITSHHPYIINNIDFKHWKLVTRNADTVKILEPESLNLGKSKHDAFIQLINLEQYRNGIGIEAEVD
jgi:predicted ATP-dependent endonuclease of OLD family